MSIETWRPDYAEMNAVQQAGVQYATLQGKADHARALLIEECRKDSGTPLAVLADQAGVSWQQLAQWLKDDDKS